MLDPVHDECGIAAVYRMDADTSGRTAIRSLAGAPPGRESLRFTGETGPQGHIFALDATPPWSGQLQLNIRVLPKHELLSHPNETGLMKWL